MKSRKEKHLDTLEKELKNVIYKNKSQDYLARASAESPCFCDLLIKLACIGLKTAIAFESMDGSDE